MAFLNPLLLFGIGAVAVPIIIHLLNRRKFQKVVWGAMRFLRVSVEQNQRRMQVEDLILLLLRCLLLVLLALALARPAIMSQAGALFGQSRVTAAIVLDHSSSMGVTDGTQSRFELARRAAEEVLDSMPSGSAVAVYFAADRVQPVIALPTFDLNLARQTIRSAPLTDLGTDLFPAIDAAIRMLQERSALRKEIYIVTDGQSAGWRQLPEIHRVLEKAREEIAAHVLLVGQEEKRNLSVSGLRLASGLTPANQPIRFEVRVSNHGDTEARDVRVGLAVDAEQPSDEFTIVSLLPGASKSVSLFARFRQEGPHAVTARIPEDRLAADDQRAFALRAIREVRVLLVDGEPGSEDREGETYFLKQALAPVPAEYLDEYFIRSTTVRDAEFAQTRWNDFDAVILANVIDFTPAIAEALLEYVRTGGGLIVFPGGKVDRRFYNEELFTRLQLLPAALGEPQGQAGQDEVFTSFQEKNYEHRLVELWNDPSAGTLASARFFRRFPLAGSMAPLATEGSANGGAPSNAFPPRLILSYADGIPAVMERDVGLGRVIQFSSTADTAWNDLPVRPSFVPLLHRALGSIVQRQDEGLNIAVGEKFVRRLPLEMLDKDVTYSKPRSVNDRRDLRRVDLINGWPTLQYEETDLAGVYDGNIAEPALTVKFAAQPGTGESDLSPMSPAQIQTVREVAQVIPWNPDTELRNLVGKQRTGMEFWLPLLLAVMAIAVTETILGQWFSRAK